MLAENLAIFPVTALPPTVALSILPARLAISAVRLATFLVIALKRLPMVIWLAMPILVLLR